MLFVSHNMAAVRQLCTRAVVLQSGQVQMIGSVGDCVDDYTSAGVDRGVKIIDHGIQHERGVTIQPISVNGMDHDQVDLEGGCRVLRIEVIGHTDSPRVLDLEAKLSDAGDYVIASFRPGLFEEHIDALPEGSFRIKSEIAMPDLAKGDDYLSICLANPTIAGYWDFPKAVKLAAEGVLTANRGFAIESRMGEGVFVLDGTNVREPINSKVAGA